MLHTSVQWIQREQDLGEQLNQAVHQGQGAQFQYLLALLSPEATDWQETQIAEEQPAWQPPFPVGVKRPLYMSAEQYQRSLKQYQQASRQDRFLYDCLDPMALVAAEQEQAFPDLVQENIPHWVRARQYPKKASPYTEADLVDLLDQLHAQTVTS